MKKSLIFIVLVIFLICILFTLKYQTLKNEKVIIASFNLNYEEFNKKNLNGLDIVTVINRAISNNEKKYVEKDSKGYYNLDDDDNIEIYIKLVKNKDAYKMERIVDTGIDSFIEYFGEVSFECTDVTYHENGRISSMTFEAKEY